MVEGKTTVPAYGADAAGEPIKRIEIERRAVSKDDVGIKVLFAGICHSDLSQAKDEWGGAVFPMVPGHEIVGEVTSVGENVTKFKVGDKVGVGCMVDSCRECEACHDDDEMYCAKGMTATYNSKQKYDRGDGDHGKLMHGGYSTRIVVSERFVCSIPDGLDLAAAAPLLCAGITTYSPLMHFGLRANHKLAVIGLGGLGHMAVKFGKAMGAEVTVFSRGTNKRGPAAELGADKFVDSTNEEEMKAVANTFDLVVDTVGVQHDIKPYLNTVGRNGKLVVVGVSPNFDIPPFQLIGQRRSVCGSLIGGMRETQEMLDFCARNKIVSDIEMIKAEQINESWERMLKSDVKYRFVIDASTIV